MVDDLIQTVDDLAAAGIRTGMPSAMS